MAEQIGNSYQAIRSNYGEEVAKILDKKDGKEDQNISEKTLSVFNLALELLQEEKSREGERKPYRMDIDYLAPWVKEVAKKALNYFENIKKCEQKSIFDSLSSDSGIFSKENKQGNIVDEIQ